jgi:hypothetical protein
MRDEDRQQPRADVVGGAATVPVQSHVRGAFLAVVGWLLLIAGIIMELAGFARWKAESSFAAGQHRWWDTYVVTPAILGLGGLVIYAGRGLRRRGRRHFARVLTSYRDAIDKPFVLYLRSFVDDVARAGLEKKNGRGVPSMVGDVVLSGRTEEEQLVAALRPLGPVVAIGRPGERLPEAGAARLYVDDAEWQSTVLRLLGHARVVVLALGAGPGLMWELLAAFNNVTPERLVLVVGLESGPYAQVREQVRLAMHEQSERLRLETGTVWTPRELPDYPAGLALKSWTSAIKGIVSFSSDWTPSFVRLDTGQVGVPRPRNQVLAATKRAMRPVFAHLVDHRP